MSLDKESGRFVTTFNNTNIPGTDIELQWVKDITLAADGTLTFDYTCIDNKVMNQQLNWIDSCTFNEDTGHFTVQFNNDNIEDIEHILNYIKSFRRSDNDHLIIEHSNPAIGEVDLGSIKYMAAAATENDPKVQNLAIDGIWFVTREI